MPEEVADRIRARLHAELGEASGARVPARRLRLLAAACAVAAVTVLAVLPAVLRPATDRAGPGPQPVAADTPEALRGAAPGAGAPSGPLADPDRVRACLTAAGVPDPGAPLLATRPYPVAGEPGVLLVLGTPEIGRLRLLVVPPDCGPGTGRVLLESTGP